MSSDNSPTSTERSVDVLEISDCRFPGQVSRTLAAEIQAQAVGGWTTAVAHVNGPLVARVFPFHPELAEHIRSGAAQLIFDREPVDARLTLVRHPALLRPDVQLPVVTTDALIVIAGVGPEREDGRLVYDPVVVDQTAYTRFGRRPVWAPANETVRDQILQRVPDAETTDDWLVADLYAPLDGGQHSDRLAARIQHPGPAAVPRVAAIQSGAVEPPAALFVTSNGAGMGHLTRLLAYARRLDGRLRAHFLSLSQAVGVVGAYGLPYEYLPSTGASALGTKEWNALFAARLVESIRRIEPEVVVFDGTYPYAGIGIARKQEPKVKWVWSRRAMWKAEHNGARAEAQVGKAALFDEVLEPGDFAETYDRGATVGRQCRHVAPVTLLDESELTSRAIAREALGLPADGRLALLSLGAGNINDTSTDLGTAVEALRKLDVDVCVTQTEIGVAGELPRDVHIVRHFPLSVYSRAFDVAVSAAGYNSFHELLRFGIPTLFVPNTETALDDQVARARFAADRGLAHYVDAVRTGHATELLADLLDNGQKMVRRVGEIDPGNGASGAADLLVGLTSAAQGAEYDHRVHEVTGRGLV